MNDNATLWIICFLTFVMIVLFLVELRAEQPDWCQIRTDTGFCIKPHPPIPMEKPI